MDHQELKYVLEELRFSAGMPPTVLDQLAAKSALRRVPAGAVLFREGSDNADLYLVREGRIALEMSVPGRGAVRILTLGPGEMVGWSALLGPGKMTASAVAVGDGEVVVFAARQLLEVAHSNHHFGYHLMRQMATALSNRLVATRLQLLDLFADVPPTIPTEPASRAR